MKFCKHCRKNKPIEDFHKHHIQKDGHFQTCADCRNGQKRISDMEYRKLHPQTFKDAQRKFKYGITPEEFQGKIASQNNQCAICHREFDTTPHVDHSHNTKEIRGLLCRSCNLALGYFEDDLERLQSAIEYLISWKNPRTLIRSKYGNENNSEEGF